MATPPSAFSPARLLRTFRRSTISMSRLIVFCSRAQPQPPLEQDILSVTFSDSLTDVDSVDLVVNNWDPGDPIPGQAVQGSFRYHNTHVFDPWQDIEISMGYYRQGQDNLQQMLVGEISTMSPTFPASGGSTLNVRALSFLHQFRTQQKTLQFKNLTDSEIAKKIVDDINTDVKKKLTKITDPDAAKRGGQQQAAKQ